MKQLMQNVVTGFWNGPREYEPLGESSFSLRLDSLREPAATTPTPAAGDYETVALRWPGPTE